MWKSGSLFFNPLKRSAGAASLVSGPLLLSCFGAIVHQQKSSERSLTEARRPQPERLVHRPSVIVNAEREKGRIPTRAEQITSLKSFSTENPLDVLVVGGGATGAGAALDATTRGLSTALIERGDFGNETSSRSTKLIWAGIRYIATAIASLLRFKNLTQPL